MKEFVFLGLGTSWCIKTDGEVLSEEVKKEILKYVKTFENQFSRFLLDSESNAFRNAKSGKYFVSEEFAKLLTVADNLRILTNGVYDPGVGLLMERAGYGVKEKMKLQGNVDKFVLPKWSLQGKTLTLNGPVVYDFGGFGKGYCIDKVSNILKRFGYKYFLVDAGGDIFATTKNDGSLWKVAIEYPGKPDMALGMVDLKNQAIAVSDSFRRRWGKWHHIVDPKTKKTVENIIGGVAVAPCALNADCMTSALFFATNENHNIAAIAYKAKYLFVRNDGIAEVDSKWGWELY